MSYLVLARAVAHLEEQLHVVPGPGLQTLCLQQLVLPVESAQLLLQFSLDALDGRVHASLGHDEMLGRVYRHLSESPQHIAREPVDPRDAVHLVAKELHAQRIVLVRQVHLDNVASHSECPSDKAGVVAPILNVDEAPKQCLTIQFLPLLDAHEHLLVLRGRPQTVDARDTGHDDDVVARHERTGRGMAQSVDLLVHVRLFGQVVVRAGNVCLRLVVVVVAHEVVDGVVWEEALQFTVELSCERLVVGYDEGGSLKLLDHIGHGEGLARARDPHEALMFDPGPVALDKRLDRRGLVAAGLEVRPNFELGHRQPRHA